MKTRANDTRTGGQAMIELAMVLPLLVLLILGVFDFACAIRSSNTISNMSREGANLAARTTFAQQDIMNAIADTAQQLDMQHNGMMYITVLNGVTGGDPTIQSQYSWTGSSLSIKPASKLGTKANPTTHSLATLNLQTGQTANVVEVFYIYQSLFSSNAARLKKQFYSRTIF
jgi:Flp pilus assembly protein TadG